MAKFTVVQRRSKSYTRPKVDSRLFDKNYEEEYNEEKKRATKELKIIDRFVIQLCRKFADKMVQTERENKKYCYMYKYNDDPDNGEVFGDTIDGLDTKYILSGRWIPLARQYFPAHLCLSVEQRLKDYISDKKFNSGIDPVTGNVYRISIFYYKNKKSSFVNGIIISRDGIRYG